MSEITDDNFIKDLEASINEAVKSGDVSKILDASIAAMERLIQIIPEEEKRIRSAALEEAARVADELGQRIKALLDNAVRNGNSLKSWPEEFAVAEDIGKSIRALKDKPHE